MTESMEPAPLAGITVVALEQAVSAPILRELGFDEAGIAGLRDAGAIGDP